MTNLGFQVRFLPAWLARWSVGRRAFVFWLPWWSRPTVYIPVGRKGNADWIALTLAHEQVHVRQWVKLGRIRFLSRYIRKAGRLQIEAEAFAESVRWHRQRGSKPEGRFEPAYYYGSALANQYGLDISVREGKKAVEQWLQE